MNLVLRAVREASGKTQAQVAKEAHISETQYQNIEYEKSDPSVRTAIRIARSLRVKKLSDFYSMWDTQSDPVGKQG